MASSHKNALSPSRFLGQVLGAGTALGLGMVLAASFTTAHAHEGGPADHLPPSPPPCPMMMHHMMPPPGTTLSYTTTGHAKAMPTRLTIRLTAQQSAPTPADAQTALNKQMETAMQTAGGHKGITALAENYTLSDQTPDKSQTSRWVANQSMSLTGNDSHALLGLAEKLQKQGLGIDDMNWSLTDSAREKLEDQAREQALTKVRPTAESDARMLGLHLFKLESVRVGPGPMPPVFARPMMMMAARANAAPAPQTSPSEQTVEVTVRVRAILMGEHHHGPHGPGPMEHPGADTAGPAPAH
ncbi:SIMPL domain-containing protein [Formicincola oecophyllae]|nr:SIMPL domain-containing protein [Formicincola oecophyllae]